MTIVKALYDQDFQLWIKQTIGQLKNRDFSALDIDHLIEELTDLGRSERNAFKSNLMILLAHLLKLKVQFDAPESMKRSWYSSVIEHRGRIVVALEDTPSLKSYLTTAIQAAYPKARKLAIKEGKLVLSNVRTPDISEYPLDCPFSVEQLLDEEFLG